MAFLATPDESACAEGLVHMTFLATGDESASAEGVVHMAFLAARDESASAEGLVHMTFLATRDELASTEGLVHMAFLAASQAARAEVSGAISRAVAACRGAGSKRKVQPKARGLTTSIKIQARP